MYLDDEVIFCCSGGGSACLSLPSVGLSVAEKHEVVKLVASKGATIEDLNRIRGRLSRTKSGRLLQAASPAQTETLILSDVIGDPVHLIGSGPTIPFDESVQVSEILNRYGIRLEEKIENILEQNEPPKLDIAPNVKIVGSNRLVLDEISRVAREEELNTIILGDTISGEANLIGQAYSDIARFIKGYCSLGDLKRSLEQVNFPSTTVDTVIGIFFNFYEFEY